MEIEQEPLIIDQTDTQADDEWQFNLKTFGVEAKSIFNLAWPVTFTNLLNFSITSASVFSLGHVGTEYLAACSLALMLCNVSGMGVAQGLASALDTLCTQAYTGSSDKHALGKHLQRGLVVCFLACIPIACLWTFSEQLMLLLGQDPQVSAISGMFTRWMLIGLYPLFVNECLRRYLQAQVAIGPHGAPLATSLVNIFIPLVTILYIQFIEGKECWGGFDFKEAFDGRQLWEFTKLGVPGVAMICSEWLAFEACAIAAGLLGNAPLAAQSAVLNTCALLYMIPLGLAVATTTRIGNCLGSSLPNGAKRVAWSALICSLISASVNATFLLSVRSFWGTLFSSDEQVIGLVKDIFPLAALYQIAESTGVTAGAGIRGCGLQRYGAMFNLTGYSIINKVII
ncbi:hypothetical protein HK103_001477 [Boothiomyces macroporosus]|uniref:MATE efflux family protein n=1 Tax=Boothiomyces macroporosus TaxID=261099 RepID=A0AAD5Y5H4_9FUNG|nr:hypothetical protein HK103_001477 [Boothiomyces macroporosus]